MKNLHTDLLHQDKDELALKKLKADNQDKDGLKEGQVRRQLKIILKKYKLDRMETSENKQTEETSQPVETTIFKDKKLDKLWEKAHNGGFTEMQLKVLKEELRDYELKLDEYRRFITEVNDKDVKAHHKQADLENHINSLLDSEQGISTLNGANDKLKEKHVELKTEYKRISEMVFNVSTGQQSPSELNEEQAVKLWELALKSDFTAEELEVLLEELVHFQNRIKKLRFFEVQLEKNELAGKSINDVDHGDVKDVSHQKHIATKVNELSQRVDKLHTQIEDRILRRHSEL